MPEQFTTFLSWLVQSGLLLSFELQIGRFTISASGLETHHLDYHIAASLQEHLHVQVLVPAVNPLPDMVTQALHDKAGQMSCLV